MTGADPEANVRGFVEAFDRERIDDFAATLADDVVIHSSRGPLSGSDAARAWATRTLGGELWQRVELDAVTVSPDAERAVATVRRQWWWRAERELASEEVVGWLFELRDGLVVSWRSSDDPALWFSWLRSHLG